MNVYKLFIFCIIFCGCNFIYENNTNHDAALEELKRETDSLKKEINVLKKQANNKDTLYNISNPVSAYRSDSVKDTTSIKRTLPKVPSDKKTVQKKTKVSKKSDTMFYYYTNTKKISAKIPARNVQGEKIRIRFYDLKGNITFEQEDVFASYSISTEIKEFHSNGAVKRIVIHFNPGASIHWYETIITFDTDNIPLWKEDVTYPMTIDNMMNNKSYWDITKKQWVKQEVVIEQPYVK
ncbi:hypothetical protein [Cytophaga aurantiaca]|uniref:hypothetical protein n=1 Tax=Cytophaga aurantiaca TaxID=29530 RepID=UPI00036B1DD4|nr:hypothetical protein [Cytophaga aurantiaca]